MGRQDAWSICIILCTLLSRYATANRLSARDNGLKVQIATAPGLLNSTVESGRILLLFGPTANDLSNTDDVTSKNKFFGKNVYNFSGQAVTFSGGSGDNTETGVFGWPIVSLDNIPAGKYFVQGYLNRYEKVTRSDGSTVSVHFPCGDGNLPSSGPGSLTTNILETQIGGGAQTIKLQFNETVPPVTFTGSEIGGCSQGNYKNTTFVKYVKIRSNALSTFWNRDMYVGATVLLPQGYNATDKSSRYPVIYSQGHWQDYLPALGFDTDQNFTSAWVNGIIPASDGKPARPAPKLILVSFRHENPFYDDSYAVNTPNLGPYGDALNEELLPYLDKTFNTIAQPYARIQEGGSTGGWESAANLIFRPDLFGACFSYYPDSLSFHRHQDIHLYTQTNAYTRNNTPVPSIREVYPNGTSYVAITTAQENHWELTFGSAVRSALQWDIWFAVFGVQGLNGYPLAAWDKVSGKIYAGAVDLWKPMDLTAYILANWSGPRNLGNVLRKRIFIYVGGLDTYYLNEGVSEFQTRISARGGADWVNVTILAGQPHGGNYNLLPTWTYLELLQTWIEEHAPGGKTPLAANLTMPTSRGNAWADVLAFGGRGAALARQVSPQIDAASCDTARSRPNATVGRWDPGVALKGWWFVDEKASGKAFAAEQGRTAVYSGKATKGQKLQLAVMGTKRDYADETRKSQVVTLS